MQALDRILIIKLGSIGDVVHTLPAVAALKKALPMSRIDWLIEKKSSVVLRNNPLIHRVIEVDTLGWRKSWLSFEVLRQIRNSLSELRNSHYDLALDFQGLWKSATFGYLSGARQLVGLDKQALREPSCRFLYSQKVAPPAQASHVIDILNELVRSLGIETNGYRFDLHVSQQDEAYVSAQLASHQIDEFLVLNPGGGWETKNWQPENYSQLHLRIRQATGLQSVVTWGPGEEKLVQEVFRHCEADPPVTFSTTIPQLTALLRRALLFVGGDTGPFHLATACYTPTVGIFGPTSPQRNGPFQVTDLVVSHQVPCGPCYKRVCRHYNRQCMRLITVDEVFQAVLKRLHLV